MSPEEYINSVVGLPYEKGADGPYSFDCWGIVPHSFLEVEGIELPKIEDRDNCDLDGSSKGELSKWAECSRSKADIFCCFHHDKMVHIGRVLSGMALHAAGDLTDGQVAVWPWRKVELVYRNLKYYRYIG